MSTLSPDGEPKRLKMSSNNFHDLQSYIKFLDRIGDLKTIESEVDPNLEITEICSRTIEEGGPALLFKNVNGSKYPLVANLFGTKERMELSLGCNPKELGQQILEFAQKIVPPKLSTIYDSLPFIKRGLNLRSKTISINAMSQQIDGNEDLDSLPILKCWPEDGGKFITMGLTITQSPLTNKRNMGMYRLQKHDNKTLGMHWHPHKGGAAHYYESCNLDKDLPVSIVLGGDPSLIFCSIAPLPENIDEVLFSAFLKNKPIDLVKSKNSDIMVPANAEFIIEGIVPQDKTKLEGPFGDHFGYYSMEANFPYLNIKTITRKIDPIFPATVVGRPPKEDMFLGDAATDIFGPLIKLVNPEVLDLWAYYEAGFHNLLVVSVDERYPKNSVKAMMSIWGTGQLSLTKCIITVPKFVDAKDIIEVFGYLGENFDPKRDLTLLQTTPLDTLDFTSGNMHVGSKVGFNCIGDGRKLQSSCFSAPEIDDPRKKISFIHEYRVINKYIIVIKININKEKAIQEIKNNNLLNEFKFIFIVSDDVELSSNVELLWGIFTRFDPSIDMYFKEVKVEKSTIQFNGQLIVDATFKDWYPNVIEMSDDIKKLVNEKWKIY